MPRRRAGSDVAIDRLPQDEGTLVAVARGASPSGELLEVPQLLARQVEDVTIAYWGRANAVMALGWTQAWPEDADLLPELVRIGATLSEGSFVPLLLQPALGERRARMSLSSVMPPPRATAR